MGARSVIESNVVKQVEVILDATEIAAANAVPYIIQTVKPGRAIVPLMIKYRFTAGVDTPLTCDACFIWEATDSSYVLCTYAWAYPTAGTDGSEVFAHDFSVAAPSAGDSLKFQSGTVLGGDSTTRLVITVAYMVM